MAYRRLSGTTNDGNEVKSIGDEIIIDKKKYEIVEINTWFDEFDNEHHVEYTIKKDIPVEPTLEELRKL